MNVTVNDLQKALDGLPSWGRCCSRIIEGMFFVRQKEELYKKGQIGMFLLDTDCSTYNDLSPGELSTIHIPKIHHYLVRKDHLMNEARTKGHDFAISGCNVSESPYYSSNQLGARKARTTSPPFSSRVERTPMKSVDRLPIAYCLKGDIGEDMNLSAGQLYTD